MGRSAGNHPKAKKASNKVKVKRKQQIRDIQGRNHEAMGRESGDLQELDDGMVARAATNLPSSIQRVASDTLSSTGKASLE